MKGLLLKDYMNVKTQLKAYPIIFALWLGIGLFNGDAGFFSGVMQMFVVMIPLTTMAYDDKTNWDRYALTMPISRQDLVVSKYVFMLLGLAATALLVFAGSVIISGDAEESLLLTLFTIPVGLVLNGILMPIVFRFGVEKGRFFFLGALALFGAGAVLISKFPAAEGSLLDKIAALPFDFTNLWSIVALCWLAGLLCAGVSLALSRRIYAKKDF